MEIFLDVIKNKYAQFDGRARRKEYWYFALTSFIIYLILYIPAIIGLIIESSLLTYLGMTLYVVFALAIFIPSLAVLVRRLHDTEKSGWFILISLIPFVGGIILIVFLFTEGTKGPNKYGEDPKAQNELDQLGQKDLV